MSHTRTIFPALLLLAGCSVDSTPDAGDGETTPSKSDVAQGVVDGKADLFGYDTCERHGWYGDGECDWYCSDPDPDCAAPPLGPDPKGAPTRYPIVVHHGFAGGHAGPLAYAGVDAALRADGHVVVQTEVPPFDATEVRVEHLRADVDAVLAETGAAKVNIVAHSMGGLDARYLIASLGYGDRVASLTTISTPHGGTAVADLGLALTPGVADPAIDALGRLLGELISTQSQSTDVRAALTDLSEAAAAAFSEENPDDARVHYQSWAGVSTALGLASAAKNERVIEACEGMLLLNEGTFDRLNPLYLLTAPVVGHGLVKPDPNDGLVTVDSSRWGDFRGCIPADHSEEVGQYAGHDGPNPDTGFDHLRFYRNLAFELSVRGF